MSYNSFTATGTTKNLAVTGTTGSVALPVLTTTSRTVRVYNSGAVAVFLEFGPTAVAAVAATSVPVPPGAVEFFEIGEKVTHVAGITAASTATVYFTEGFGQ